MLNIALAGASLLGALNNERRSSNLTNRGYSYYDQAATQAGQSFRQLSNAYNTAVASGIYNPDAAIQLAQKAANNAFKLGTGNITQRLANLGYKPGDSNMSLDPRDFTEGQKINLLGNIAGIRQQYAQNQFRDASAVAQAGNNYASQLGSLGQSYLKMGQDTSGSLGNTIGTLSTSGILKGAGGVLKGLF